jgi:hypothetical protein
VRWRLVSAKISLANSYSGRNENTAFGYSLVMVIHVSNRGLQQARAVGQRYFFEQPMMAQAMSFR